jgi:antitoxin HigA-1
MPGGDTLPAGNQMTTTQTEIEERIPYYTVGSMLTEEFLEPMGISPYRLAKETGLSRTLISEIIAGTRSITANTAIRFSAFFGNSPEFWLNLQNHLDMRKVRQEMGEEISRIRRWDTVPQRRATAPKAE